MNWKRRYVTLPQLNRFPLEDIGVKSKLENRRIKCFKHKGKDVFYFQFKKLNAEDRSIDSQHISISKEALIKMLHMVVDVESRTKEQL